jgi:hypothetical protein
VGHHKITARRPSVYHRYINRGFYSCICPKEIKNRVSFADLQLIYWFPNLDTQDEHRLHSRLKTLYHSKGEWYKYGDLDDILDIVVTDLKGVSEVPVMID